MPSEATNNEHAAPPRPRSQLAGNLKTHEAPADISDRTSKAPTNWRPCCRASLTPVVPSLSVFAPMPHPPSPLTLSRSSRPIPSQAWFGGFVAGVLRYLFVLATGARELPPSPIGPAGRWFAKWAALASVAALAASVGNGKGVADAAGGEEGEWALGGGGGAAKGSSPLLCAAGVAVLCASFSVDFFQIWVLLPREAAAAARAAAVTSTAKALATATATVTTDGEIRSGGARDVGVTHVSQNGCFTAEKALAEVAPCH